MEGREPSQLPGVRVGAAPEQESGGLLLPRGGGALQRGHLELVVSRHDVDERAPVDEQARGFRVPEERSQVQRCEPVLGPGADEPRIGLEQLADALRPAQRGSLEDVERGSPARSSSTRSSSPRYTASSSSLKERVLVRVRRRAAAEEAKVVAPARISCHAPAGMRIASPGPTSRSSPSTSILPSPPAPRRSPPCARGSAAAFRARLRASPRRGSAPRAPPRRASRRTRIVEPSSVVNGSAFPVARPSSRHHPRARGRRLPRRSAPPAQLGRLGPLLDHEQRRAVADRRERRHRRDPLPGVLGVQAPAQVGHERRAAARTDPSSAASAASLTSLSRSRVIERRAAARRRRGHRPRSRDPRPHPGALVPRELVEHDRSPAAVTSQGLDLAARRLARGPGLDRLGDCVRTVVREPPRPLQRPSRPPLRARPRTASWKSSSSAARSSRTSWSAGWPSGPDLRPRGAPPPRRTRRPRAPVASASTRAPISSLVAVTRLSAPRRPHPRRDAARDRDARRSRT